MVEAFATFQDLEKRLNRTFTVLEQAWITTLLEDASTYLREDVIGLQVFPQSTVTFSARPVNGEVALPQQPVVEVISVTSGGQATPFSVEDGVVFVSECDEVTITFTFGYSEAPESLKRWACVLVSQALVPLELKLGLAVGGLSSIAIDDFRVAFADGGEATGMTLTERNAELIRAQYRGTATVVGSR